MGLKNHGGYLEAGSWRLFVADQYVGLQFGWAVISVDPSDLFQGGSTPDH